MQTYAKAHLLNIFLFFNNNGSNVETEERIRPFMQMEDPSEPCVPSKTRFIRNNIFAILASEIEHQPRHIYQNGHQIFKTNFWLILQLLKMDVELSLGQRARPKYTGTQTSRDANKTRQLEYIAKLKICIIATVSFNKQYIIKMCQEH